MRRGLALAAALLVSAPAAAQAATPEIHAHRGGPFVAGTAAYPEDTMPAYRAAAAEGFVLEVDAVLAADGVVVLHDSTLDRTTTCTGRAIDMTLEQIRACPSDIVGSPGSSLGSQLRPGGEPPPPLAEFLAFAKQANAKVNLELKEFDGARVAANRIVDGVIASGFPLRNLIVQSFFPLNLDVARRRIPAAARSTLSLKAFNAAAIAGAKKAGSKWISPEWPVNAAYVRRAHARKLKVVPYTLNRAAHVRAAAKAGVDAIITDDPVMARRALRRARG